MCVLGVEGSEKNAPPEDNFWNSPNVSLRMRKERNKQMQEMNAAAAHQWPFPVCNDIQMRTFRRFHQLD